MVLVWTLCTPYREQWNVFRLVASLGAKTAEMPRVRRCRQLVMSAEMDKGALKLLKTIQQRLPSCSQTYSPYSAVMFSLNNTITQDQRNATHNTSL